MAATTVTSSPTALTRDGVKRKHYAKNLCKNPCFAADTVGQVPTKWSKTSTGVSTFLIQSSPSLKFSSKSLQVVTTTDQKGVRILKSADNFVIQESVPVGQKRYYHLSIWLKSASVCATPLALILYGFDGTFADAKNKTISMPADMVWRRYDIALVLHNGATDIEFNVLQNGSGTRSFRVGAAVITYLGNNSNTFPVDFFDGASTGCSWLGTANASESQQPWGELYVPNSGLDINFSKPFWMMLDCKLDLPSTERRPHALYLATIGQWLGDGSGNFTGPVTGLYLDSQNAKLTVYRAPTPTSYLKLPTTTGAWPRKATVMVVVSWDETNGLRIWQRVGGGDIVYAVDGTDTVAYADEDWSLHEVVLMSGRNGFFQASYTAEGSVEGRTNAEALRYFAIGQGAITDAQAREMLRTGKAPIATTGIQFDYARMGFTGYRTCCNGPKPRTHVKRTRVSNKKTSIYKPSLRRYLS